MFLQYYLESVSQNSNAINLKGSDQVPAFSSNENV